MTTQCSCNWSVYTVKLCYSESGQPRHIFSLLLSSRYSQMTNLPRKTKGNNLGTSTIDLHGLQCDGGCITLGLREGRECQQHRAHSSQTKMRGGRGGGGEGGGGVHTTQGHAFRCFSLLPATTRCALPGTWRQGGGGARTFVTRKDRKSLVITEMIIH